MADGTPAPPELTLLCIAVMLALHFLVPTERVVRYPANLIGLPVVIAGFALSYLGSRLFRRRGTNIQTFGEPGMLVTDGLFRWSRNPMSLGFLLFLLGIALVRGTALSALVVAIFFVVADRWYIRFEEDALTRKFGHDYLAYRQNTRRWI